MTLWYNPTIDQLAIFSSDNFSYYTRSTVIPWGNREPYEVDRWSDRNFFNFPWCPKSLGYIFIDDFDWGS